MRGEGGGGAGGRSIQGAVVQGRGGVHGPGVSVFGSPEKRCHHFRWYPSQFLKLSF